jgi:serine phosphatase RsbU (regulator of sigma subunit)
MTDFAADYERAFKDYLRNRSEAALGAAYELGRSAVAARVGVLDLADAHHRALAGALGNGSAGDPAVATAAADFFREALATFELALRGYTEAQETVRLQSEHAERQRMLAAASVAINAELQPEAILRVAAGQAQRILQARRAEVEVRLRRELGMPPPLSGAHGDGLRVVAPDGEAGDEGAARVEAPIMGRGSRRLGTLAVIDSERPEGEREPLALQLAQTASVALENAQLYARERAIAQTLQQSLLPPSLPDIPGLDVAARFSPAGDGIQVGGDFYDVFRARDDEWCMVIGDVCGKGPEAAALTALTRYTIRAAALHERRPSVVLAMLNQAMLDQRQDGRFATVLFLRLQMGPGRVRVVAASGGHPLPLLLRRDGRVDAVGAGGTLLGVIDRPVLPDAEVDLYAGDSLVLYTDGVIEVRAGGKEIFGGEELSTLLAASAGLSPDELLGRIQQQVLHESHGRPQDDVALLGLRVRS